MRIISAVVREGYILPSATRQVISSKKGILEKEQVIVSLRQLWDWEMVGKMLEAYESGRTRQVGKQLTEAERRFRRDVFTPALNHHIRSPPENEEDSALHLYNAIRSFAKQQRTKRYDRIRPIISQKTEPLIMKIKSQPLNHLKPQCYGDYPLVIEEVEDLLGLEEYFEEAVEVFRDSVSLLTGLRKQAIIFNDLSKMLRILSNMGIYTWGEARAALTFETFPTDKEG